MYGMHVHKEVIKNKEISIDLGKFFSGFFISPAIAAIFVTPA